MQELRSIDLSIGLSRRSLLVYAMGITLESLVDFVDPSEKLIQFQNLIVSKVGIRGSRSILGLRDPLEYVTSMIENLARIGSELNARRLKIIGFKLTHPAILIGTTADGLLLTLLAYCGGWMEVPVRARCGTTPLVFGSNEHCGSCGHLVCKNCGHCLTGCVECNDRQEQVVKDHLQSATPQSARRNARFTQVKNHVDWDALDDY